MATASDSFEKELAALYFGNVPVTFAPINGKTVSNCSGVLTEEQSEDPLNSQKRVKARLEPLDHLGDEYKDLIVPAIPAPDLIISKIETLDNLPQIFHTPIFKVPSTHEKKLLQLHAVASGRRSALNGFD